MECTDAVTGVPRYVICAVGRDDGAYVMTPFGHLHDGDPFEAYLPPATDRSDQP
jgi:lysozyme family protein